MQNPGSSAGERFRQWMRAHPRWAGAGFLSLGAPFANWFLLEPIRDAQAGAQEVSINMNGVALGIIIPLFGLSLLVMGPKLVRDPNAATGRERRIQIAVGPVLAAVGCAVYFWLKTFLESRGYVFS